MAHKAISREDPIVQVFIPVRRVRSSSKTLRGRPQDYPFLEPKDLAICGTRLSQAFRNGMHSQTMCKDVPVVVRSDHVRTICEAER